MRYKQRLFRAEALTRSFAIVVSAYSVFVDMIYTWMLDLKMLYLWHVLKQCLEVPIRALSVEYPSSRRAQVPDLFQEASKIK